LLSLVIKNVKYNSYEQLEKLFDNYLLNKVNWNTLKETFLDLDLSKININKWCNCVGISIILQKMFAQIGIDSKLIRFDSWWLINNDYVINCHSSLVIPFIKDWLEYFILTDPWLIIPQSITFSDRWDSQTLVSWEKKYKITYIWSDELQYMFEIWNKKLFFDPYNEWLNPNETLNKDIMRAIWDYKIVRQNSFYKPTQFIFNIQHEEIVLSLKWNKIVIPMSDFIILKENSILYKIYQAVMYELWENHITFYRKSIYIISNLWKYKEEIWAPSTKDLINNNN
jgi:hypothetical protein